MRPIFPSKISGEEGWCLKVANRLSTTDGSDGCLGGSVVRECSTLDDEEDATVATLRREARSSSGGGGIGGSCNEKIKPCRSRLIFFDRESRSAAVLEVYKLLFCFFFRLYPKIC